MSTNYYCRNKNEYRKWLLDEKWLDGIIKKAVGELEVLQFEQRIIDSIVDKIKNEYAAQEYRHRYEEFHIGKRSGRTFNLEAQENYYESNKTALFKWLADNKEEYEIVNEYEEVITIDELREIIDSVEHKERWLYHSFC